MTGLLRNVVALACIFTSPIVFADLYSELTDLKKICDDGLLTENECEAQRQVILNQHNTAGNQLSWYCNYAGESDTPRIDGLAFDESAEPREIVKEILDAAGVAPNFIVRSANVPNASASIRGGTRYIEYRMDFVDHVKQLTGTNWAVYSILAHEIGHHFQGHTIQSGGSRPDIELEADEYSGFILSKLGATLDDAQLAMRTLGSDSSSGTHPPTSARLEAIGRGWREGADEAAADDDRTQRSDDSQSDDSQSDDSPAMDLPRVVYTDSCVIEQQALLIQADGAVVLENQPFRQVANKMPSTRSPLCVFEIHTNFGWYCVHSDGLVYFGGPQPVGQCTPLY